MNENSKSMEALSASMTSGCPMAEGAEANGRYHFQLYEYEGGPLVREWDQGNIVCTAGKNAAFNAFLAGSAYTVTGPFLGLISSTTFSAVSVNDTMASHTGWLEAGSTNAPTFSGARQTAVFSSASGGAIQLSTALSFTFTGAGTVQGAFLAFGTGAVATVGSTAGTLYSAGTFATAQPVVAGNVIAVSYSTSM